MKYQNILFFLLLMVLSFSMLGLALDVYWNTPIDITPEGIGPGLRTFTAYLKVVDEPLPELYVKVKIDGTQVYDRTLKSIPKGALRKITFQQNVGIGSHKVQFIIDPTNVVNESNEGNNMTEKTFSVFLQMSKIKMILKPDLTVQSITTAPPFPQQYKNYTVVIIYKNSGAIAIEDDIKIKLKRDGIEVKTWTINLPLAAGQSRFVAFQTASVSGVFNYKAILDPDNTIKEKNEFNNTKSVPIEVHKPVELAGVSEEEK